MRHLMIPFAALACAAFILAAPPLAQPDDEPGILTSGRLAQSPDQYYGEHVRVRGEVARTFDRRAFTLDEDRPLLRHDLLVVAPRPLVNVREGAEVVVSGYVRRLVPSELRRDYDWFADTVPRDALDGAGRRPVLVADSIVIRSLGDRDRDRDLDDDRVERAAGAATRPTRASRSARTMRTTRGSWPAATSCCRMRGSRSAWGAVRS